MILAAQRATLVKRIRYESGRHTLLVDAGDICDGTPFSTEYQGDADIAAMNAIGYDVACPGNHEYNNTLSQVKHLISEAHFPLVSANSTLKADGKLLYQPYIIKEVGGAKIAFFGLLTYDAQTYPVARNELSMEVPIEAAKKLVPILRKQADLVVAVTHIGVDDDIKLAAEVPGIDVIVGGHSHTLLPKPVFIPHPTDTASHSVHGTIIVQDFQWAGTLGRLDLTLYHAPNGAWTVEKYAEVVGEAAGDFATKSSDHAEYNFVADAVREQMGVDFDIENMGGVRTSLNKGLITYADLVTLDPFGNTIITFRATGKQIQDILTKFRPSVSGIQYVYDNGQLSQATINGKHIEPDNLYSGATNSYYARFILSEIADKTDTKQQRLDAEIAYIRKRKLVSPAYDGRRVIKGIGDFD